MAITDIGSNIRRAMKLRGYSIAKLAKAIDMGTASISNILNNKSEPKSSTLLKFSEALDISLKDILSEAPRLNNVRFRSLKTLSAREKAAKEQILITAAKWLENFNMLEELLGNKIEFSLNKLKCSQPKDLAVELRRNLDFSEDAPIYNIANLLEKKGIKLKIMDFGFKKIFGISVGFANGGPAILINSDPSISIERQIFSIAHELGHLLMHKNSFSTDIPEELYNEQERDADIFAGYFLLPEQGFKKEWLNASGLHWVDAVLHIKKIFKVSYKTVLLRLAELKADVDKAQLMIQFAIDFQKKYVHDLKNHYEPDQIEDPVAPTDPDGLSRYDLVEDRYAFLIKNAFDKEFISFDKAAKLLGKSTMEMRELSLSWSENTIGA